MHPIADHARHAYAAGWASAGGPLTNRVMAGCEAAVALAIEHAERADILEVTLHLGHLEGMWAMLFDRREHLVGEHARLAAGAWAAVLTGDMIAYAVTTYRRDLGIREGDQQDAYVLAAATAAAERLLRQLPSRPAWAVLRHRLRDAIAAGRAEGIVGAVAIAAEEAGDAAVLAAANAALAPGSPELLTAALDWNLAFDEAYAALDRLHVLWADADGWLEKILGRATQQLGRVLADLTAAGASYADMVAAASELLSGADVEAVGFVVDWALSTGLSHGALDLYRSEGVERVDVLSAGDQRVCPRCYAAEDGNPHLIADVPLLPLHPHCRCTHAASLSSLRPFGRWFT